MRKAALICLAVFCHLSSFGQDAMDRLEALETIENVINRLSSCMYESGDFREMDKDSFESSFTTDASLIAPALFLNKQKSDWYIDQGEDPVSRYPLELMEGQRLDFMQAMRHLYQEMPKFSVQVRQIVKSISGDEIIAYCDLELWLSGTLNGFADAEGEQLSDYISTNFPLPVIFELKRQGPSWKIASWQWEKPNEVPRFVLFGFEKTGSNVGVVDPVGWYVEDGADSKGVGPVKELSPGLYICALTQPNVTFEYDHPFVSGQRFRLEPTERRVEVWLKEVREGAAGIAEGMQLVASPRRIEWTVSNSPGLFVRVGVGDGEIQDYTASGGYMRVHKNNLNNLCPGVMSSAFVELGFGKISKTLTARELSFERGAQDDQGDSYSRLTNYDYLTQSMDCEEFSVGYGFQRLKRLNRRGDKYWLGWSASASALVGRGAESQVQSQGAISGKYDQYFGVTFGEGVNDFGMFSNEQSQAFSSCYGGRGDVSLVLRCAPPGSSFAGLLRAGIRASSLHRSGSDLVPEEFLSLEDTYASVHEVAPSFQLGLSWMRRVKQSNSSNEK